MSAPKLVIVDDDDLIRDIICEVAKEAFPSAEIAEHRSATLALHEIETGTVDLLITNCHMPDMDGPTLVKTLRKTKHALPIIMVSGSEDARKLGEMAGIDRFVPKHLIQALLGEAIGALLPASAGLADTKNS